MKERKDRKGRYAISTVNGILWNEDTKIQKRKKSS